MSIFGEREYYPVPSSKVIGYGGGRREIVWADIIALVVRLTSPVDAVEYEMFADFFLVYRNFITAERLLGLLVERFEWARGEIDGSGAGDGQRRAIGEVTLVRTFVLIRHWIVNYFSEDFLANRGLREQFVAFLNGMYRAGDGASPRVVLRVTVNLKKAWAFQLKLMWVGTDLEQELGLKTYEDWLGAKMIDITEMRASNGDVRKSRLSFYALQSSNNPSFRNKSVLSFYNTKDIFQLPTAEPQGSRRKKRTASMFLFPQNNLSMCQGTLTEPVETQGKPQEAQGAARTISHISKSTNVSNVFKEIAYPSTPVVETFIPPTPSKKLEFILNSTYSPSTPSWKTGRDAEATKPKHLHGYRMIAGLLSKWKSNHYRPKENCVAVNVEPEMENLIKYVFSITSLEYSQNDLQELVESIPSRFDILSARTIEEVEYLITIENEMARNITQHQNQAVTAGADSKSSDSSETAGGSRASALRQNSVIDNLNIYGTVNAIGASVLNLSRAASVSRQSSGVMHKRLISAKRRRPHSMATFHNSVLRTPISDNLRGGSLRSAKGCKCETSPYKCERHHSERVSRRRLLVSSETRFTSPKDHLASPVRGDVQSSAPLIGAKPSHEEMGDSEDEMSDSIISSVTYDSSIHEGKLGKPADIYGKDESSDSDGERPAILRKHHHKNLREFMFEPESPAARDSVSGSIQPTPSSKMEDHREPKGLGSPRMQRGNRSRSRHIMEDSPRISIGAYLCFDSEANCDKTVSSSTSELSANLKNTNSYPSDPAVHNANVNVISPASGRIGIIRKSNMGPKIHPMASPMIFNDSKLGKESDVFTRHEANLNALEEDLHAIITGSDLGDSKNRLIKSETDTSIATKFLFNSTNASPQKEDILNDTIYEDEGTPDLPRTCMMKLSSTPSIQSVISNGMSLESTRRTNTTAPHQEKSQSAGNRYTGSKFLSQVDSLLGYFNENGSRYLFAQECEPGEEASPIRDMEVLKTNFMQQDTSYTESRLHSDISGLITARSPGDASPQSKDGSLSALEDLRSLVPSPTPAKQQSDPVKVALMKLEGTFSKPKAGTNPEATEETARDSLLEEVENLDITELNIPKIANKRQSMFIERRRTAVDQSTSSELTSEDCETEQTPPRSSDCKIRMLLENYKVRDPRLNISNVNQHVPFILMYDSLSIAKQMTLVEREVLSEIDWKDLLNLNMRKYLPKVTSWLQLLLHNEELSGIDLAIARFNLTVDWIISELVMTTDVKLRRNVLQRFIHVAEHCKDFQNFNTVMEIVLALNSVVVQKFIDSWRLIEPGDMLTWKNLKCIPSLDKNYCNIRQLLNNVDPIKGCIPFLVVYLSDLSLNSEKRDWIVPDKVINYDKFQTNVQIVKNFIQRLQWSKFYDIQPDDELLSKCVYISTLSHEEIAHLTTF